MLDITGAKLISTAYVFGTGAVVFSTLPFMFVIVRGIMVSNHQNIGGSNVITTIIVALIVHVISCVSFILAIKMLDLLNKVGTSNLLQEKAFKIFWARDKTEALTLANATADNIEVEGAYVILFTIRSVIDITFLFLPIMILILSLAYGVWQAKKDTYKNDYFYMFFNALMSATASFIVYILFAKIASYGMFIPNSDLLTHIYEGWNNILTK